MDVSNLPPLPVFLFATLLGTGCAMQQGPVPLQGTPEAIRQLEGTWEGEYINPDGGVLASVSFVLEAGTEMATGDVVVLRSWNTDALNAGTGVGALDGPPLPLLLQIEFVRCQGGTVRGTLEPYRDPVCDCLVYTDFEGVLDGDQITGRFRMWPSEGTRNTPLEEGSWKITRTTTTR